MDWTACELVEVIPGKVSGVPLVIRTRIQADIIFEYLDSAGGLAEFAVDYPSLFPRADYSTRRICGIARASRRLVRVLLDENLPHQLRLSLQRHEVSTAQYSG